MINPSVSIEDYLGAIYRLQRKDGQPLPLGDLQEHFGFSPISIHEMVQKLVQRGLAVYIPYKGVLLTSTGSTTAEALIRRHRIWECFLANELAVPIDEAHQLAGDLEHAAPDWITERLFNHLGQPSFCPHGSAIDELTSTPVGISIANGQAGRTYVISCISPENSNSLQIAREAGILPGSLLTIIEKKNRNIEIEINDQKKQLSEDDLAYFWGMDMTDGS